MIVSSEVGNPKMDKMNKIIFGTEMRGMRDLYLYASFACVKIVNEVERYFLWMIDSFRFIEIKL